MPRSKATPYPVPEICPYCGAPVIYTSNATIYGREYGNGRCYKCTGCDAYVGVHNGTKIPLGRMANRELRELKKRAHALFDPIWKNGHRRRDAAYGWLALHLEIPERECHFGWFDKEMLLRAIEFLESEVSNGTQAPPGNQNMQGPRQEVYRPVR